MVIPREVSGSKAEILKQIEGMSGRIVSAIVMVEGPVPPIDPAQLEAEFAKFVEFMEANSVEAPHADDSREAIYTRMPGE